MIQIATQQLGTACFDREQLDRNVGGFHAALKLDPTVGMQRRAQRWQTQLVPPLPFAVPVAQVIVVQLIGRRFLLSLT